MCAFACFSTPSSPSSISTSSRRTFSGSRFSRAAMMRPFFSVFVPPTSILSFSKAVRRPLEKSSCTIPGSRFLTKVACRFRKACFAVSAILIGRTPGQDRRSAHFQLLFTGSTATVTCQLRPILLQDRERACILALWRYDVIVGLAAPTASKMTTERGLKSSDSSPTLSTPTRSLATSDGHRQDRHVHFHCDSPAREKTIGHSLPSSSSGATARGSERSDKVTLLVDGKRFNVNPTLFTKQPNTMLGRLAYTRLLLLPVCSPPSLLRSSLSLTRTHTLSHSVIALYLTECSAHHWQIICH